MPDGFAYATSPIKGHTMHNLTVQQLTRPKQRPANDDGPSQPAGSADQASRRTMKLTLLIFGLLSLTIVSCLLGIGVVEIFLRWA